MKNRIKRIRTDAGLSMEKFGERIGITKSSVSLLESGKNNPSEQTIKLICREFSINKDWILTGKGEMYDVPEDEVAAVVADLLEESNPFYDIIISIMKSYKKLDDTSRAALNVLIRELFNEMKEGD